VLGLSEEEAKKKKKTLHSFNAVLHVFKKDILLNLLRYGYSTHRTQCFIKYLSDFPEKGD
jgi:hypothetical protein